MKTLKRSECCILPLVLKKRWFDMVALGQKKEEYRDYSEYWKTRIWNWMKKADAERVPMVIEFRLGYATHARRTAFLAGAVALRGAYRFEHPDWGEPCGMHYVLGLGERVELAGGKAKMLPGAGRVCDNTGHKARKEKNLRQE